MFSRYFNYQYFYHYYLRRVLIVSLLPLCLNLFSILDRGVGLVWGCNLCGLACLTLILYWGILALKVRNLSSLTLIRCEMVLIPIHVFVSRTEF